MTLTMPYRINWRPGSKTQPLTTFRTLQKRKKNKNKTPAVQIKKRMVVVYLKK